MNPPDHCGKSDQVAILRGIEMLIDRLPSVTRAKLVREVVLASTMKGDYIAAYPHQRLSWALNATRRYVELPESLKAKVAA